MTRPSTAAETGESPPSSAIRVPTTQYTASPTASTSITACLPRSPSRTLKNTASDASTGRIRYHGLRKAAGTSWLTIRSRITPPPVPTMSASSSEPTMSYPFRTARMAPEIAKKNTPTRSTVVTIWVTAWATWPVSSTAEGRSRWSSSGFLGDVVSSQAAREEVSMGSR